MRAGAMIASVLMLALYTPHAAAETFSFEGDYALALTGAATPLGTTSSGPNCIAFEQAASGVSGIAVATWDAQSPLDQRLELVFAPWGEDEDIARESGTSPLHISFSDAAFSVHESGIAALIAVQFADTGAAFEQPIELHVSFNYDADGPLEPVEAGCSIG